jgi:hypothetical protein
MKADCAILRGMLTAFVSAASCCSQPAKERQSTTSATVVPSHDAVNRIDQRSSGPRALTWSESRLRVEAALGSASAALRVTEQEDEAEIGPLGCTGSASECMHWFKVERRSHVGWSFLGYFAVDPYANRLFVSHSPNLEVARSGAYEPFDASKQH